MTSKKPKLFTIGLRCGRMANRMILFANFVALAEEQGHRLINFTFHSYSEFFEGTRGNIYCQYPRPKRKSWMDVVPGVAAALRKTRIPYHLTRATAVRRGCGRHGQDGERCQSREQRGGRAALGSSGSVSHWMRGTRP